LPRRDLAQMAAAAELGIAVSSHDKLRKIVPRCPPLSARITPIADIPSRKLIEGKLLGRILASPERMPCEEYGVRPRHKIWAHGATFSATGCCHETGPKPMTP